MKYTVEQITQEALRYKTKKEFFTYSEPLYRAAIRKDLLTKVCAHMPENNLINNAPYNKKWNEETLTQEALRYKTRNEFKKGSLGAYKASLKLNLIDIVCKHMNFVRTYWSDEDLIKEASKYKTIKDFTNANESAYQICHKRNLLKTACAHMEILWEQKWQDFEKIKQEATKYKTRTEFRKQSNGAYNAARKLGLLKKDNAFNMAKRINQTLDNNPNFKWSKDKIEQEALKYRNRTEFARNCAGARNAADRINILDEVCIHMKLSATISKAESDLHDIIKEFYPKTQKLRETKLNIPNKPYITAFDIDIYIPELRKGIEFDGRYWHSYEGLKRGRPNWPDEDLKNYHNLKDKYFANKGIKLIHIKEENWIENKELCIKECLEFLEI